jgi:hypothetical protein
MNPFFIPPVKYVPTLVSSKFYTIRALCAQAGVLCRASGSWTQRKVQVVYASTLGILAEPGDWGAVRVEIPEKRLKQRSQIALYLLAYGLHDLVAKQSIMQAEWNEVNAPRGRPRCGGALPSRDRQRRFRERQKIVKGK